MSSKRRSGNAGKSHQERLLRAITANAKRGFYQFVLPKGSKIPFKKSNGFKDATDDVSGLKESVKANSHVNLGIRTGTISGVLAIDVDVNQKEGKDGFADLKRMEAVLGKLPKTRTNRTGSGGLHLLFKCTEPLPSSQKKLANAIDVRADDGYIVAPPSIVKGARYKVQDKQDLAPLPKKWRDAIRSANELPDSSLHGDGTIVKGGRNTFLTKQAFDMRHHGMSNDDALQRLRYLNEVRCVPPEKDSRVVSLIGRVFSTEPSNRNARPLRETTTLAEIGKMKLKPLVWVVRGILPEGVALLVGPPKIGKSILKLQAGLAVAKGQALWSDEPEKKGEVLYLAYEDNNRRMRKRARQLSGDDKLPSNFHVDYDWPRLDAGGKEDLDTWLTAHPKARMVIIDTLAKFRGQTSNKRTAYDFDYSVGQALVPLAHKHHVAIVLVHHTAKGKRVDVLESVNSTNGLPGGVDTVMILGRERGSEAGALFVTGRDVEDDVHWSMAKRPKIGWTVIGEAAEGKKSAARKAVIDVIANLGPSSPKEIAAQLGRDGSAVRQLLKSMIEDGDVREKDGRYRLPKKPIVG